MPHTNSARYFQYGNGNFILNTEIYLDKSTTDKKEMLQNQCLDACKENDLGKFSASLGLLRLMWKINKNFIAKIWDNKDILIYTLKNAPLADEARRYIWERVISEKNHIYLKVLEDCNLQLPKQENLYTYGIEHLAALSQDKKIIMSVLSREEANPNAVTLAKENIWQCLYVELIIPFLDFSQYIIASIFGIKYQPYLHTCGTTALHILAAKDECLYKEVLNTISTQTSLPFACNESTILQRF